MLRSKEIELVVSGLSLSQGGHEGLPILGDKEGGESDDLQILSADVGHPGGEMKLGWGRRALWLLGFLSCCIPLSPC